MKHVKPTFFIKWLNHIRKYSNRKLFAVGEYWSTHIDALKHFIEITDGGIMLFDSGIHYNFADAGKKGKDGKEYKIEMPSHRWIIDKFLETRKKYAYGDQYDYFDHPNCVGWTRTGNENHKGGIAVLLSNGENGFKNM